MSDWDLRDKLQAVECIRGLQADRDRVKEKLEEAECEIRCSHERIEELLKLAQNWKAMAEKESYTNKDLKRLKEQYAIAGIEAIGNRLPDLIGRLEAAEIYAEQFHPYGPIQHSLLKAWRKAAGK